MNTVVASRRRRAVHAAAARRGSRHAASVAVFVAAVACICPAAAQVPPPGYTMERDADGYRLRPDGEADDAVDIRVAAPLDGVTDPLRAIADWIASHPAPGELVGRAVEPKKGDKGLYTAARFYRSGKRTIQEGFALLPLGNRRYQLEIVRVPTDRGDVQQHHIEVSGKVAGAVSRGEYTAAFGSDSTPVPGASAEATPPPSPAPTRRVARPTRPPLPEETPEALSKRMRGLAENIETVGFVNQTRMGVGGMILLSPTPVVLFKSGDALYDMDDMRTMRSIEAERAAHPDRWTHWRRGSAGIEIQGEKGWAKLDYTNTMDRLPPGYTLSGSYGSLSGVGNIAVGGTDSVVAWSNWQFDRSGEYSLGGGASASSTAKGAGTETHTTTNSQTRGRRGRYVIDGYLLVLHGDDGREETHLLVTDEKDPSVIWLDGDGHTRKKK